MLSCEGFGVGWTKLLLCKAFFQEVERHTPYSIDLNAPSDISMRTYSGDTHSLWKTSVLGRRSVFSVSP